MSRKAFGFKIEKSLGDGTLARAGVITTPHGEIETPAFVAVGTKATIKSLVPEQILGFGAQAVLANAYHLYLQPGPQVIDEAGGLAKFMNWPGPTFTDSGGFQVLSLGSGYKKVLSLSSGGVAAEDVVAKPGERLAKVDDEGVTFKSHTDGSKHRFSPEISMQIQHGIGADIMFAFDECTSLMHTRAYQRLSLDRTHRWAERCIAEHERLTAVRVGKPYQALFGVVQGAQYEDMRRESAKFIGSLPFDGFGLGGAFEKEQLGTIVRWMNEELPEDKPKHLLGLSEPDDIFTGIENGTDTFDCVAPARMARNGTIMTLDGRLDIKKAIYAHDGGPLFDGCDCYTCANFTRAYLNHLVRSKEMLASTLNTIHNERFIVRLVEDIRASIIAGSFFELKAAWLGRYYAKKA